MNTKRIIGAIMAVAAIIFVIFALNHPEMSFPWNNTVTYGIYIMYGVVTAILLTSKKKK
jgi:protein-S-isoprenylcysteine O-methyltransferase Ste14